ncbi:MAG: M1 family metallopeptidase [Saprospiraceae bacterium]|nr:M1 family metallopeptidase [Saprospiraceae bacterium]
MKQFLALLFIYSGLQVPGLADTWQQKADYRIQVDLDVENHRYTGQQQLFYFNHSPDTLYRLYYHLYNNAFQPGSMMDVRSGTIPDPDARVSDRISQLAPNEIGFLKIYSLTLDGRSQDFEVEGTILEVVLERSIPPRAGVLLEMEFEGQVPLQIRRSGRDNKEGISYSMVQWYPKISEYDRDGWHPDPYVAREFYGVWSNFDVQITLDNQLVVAATGVLQNGEDIGYGYSNRNIKHKRGGKLTWHFKAEGVHDFAWAADPDYTHTNIEVDEGKVFRFFYQKGKNARKTWGELPEIMKEAYRLIVARHGEYPYPVYSFIQGGDGGMEYPMATLITGERGLSSLVGVSIHELMHSWYQGLLATNELLYPWMDEGFTELAEVTIKNELRKSGHLGGPYQDKPYTILYSSYRKVAKMGIEEAMNTHADHYRSNTAYGMAAYNKGAIFLKQLEYIVGEEHYETAMRKYYEQWKFRHPRDVDLLRIFEKQSQMVLDWYLQYFVYTTKLIEYKISSIEPGADETVIRIDRQGEVPMPIDVEVFYSDGTSSLHTVPLRIMRNAKTRDGVYSYQVEPDWPWTDNQYLMRIKADGKSVKAAEIDPTLRLADFDLSNNRMEVP